MGIPSWCSAEMPGGSLYGCPAGGVMRGGCLGDGGEQIIGGLGGAVEDLYLRSVPKCRWMEPLDRRKGGVGFDSYHSNGAGPMRVDRQTRR